MEKDVIYYLKKYNCAEHSIIDLLRNNNITIRPIRTLFFDEHFFDDINLWSRAYLLGLLDADGSINIKGSYVTLSMIDREPIEYLAKCVNYPGTIKLPKIYGKNNKQQYMIKLCSKHMVQQLIEKGCVSRKTYHLDFPPFDIVPSHLIKAWLLGLCDGDGSIMRTSRNKHSCNSKSLTVTYIGTVPLIEGIKKFIDENIDVYSKINYNPSKASFPMARIMMCGQKNALPFLDYIYKDHEFCLARKYNRYKEMKEYYEQRREEKAAKHKI